MIEGLRVLHHVRTCQNHVFKAQIGDDLVVLRLTDPAHRSVRELGAEIDVLNDLHGVTSCAIQARPFPSGRFIEPVVHEGGDFNAVAFPWIEGGCPAISSFHAAARFGELLGRLHHGLAKLPGTYDLPHMASANTLIHGDFNVSNVLQAADMWIVIDFENMCYGTREYELANALYMQLFDHRGAMDELLDSGFAAGFLVGYAQDNRFDPAAVRLAMAHRVSMLAGWLRAPATAPLAISTSPESWKNELRSFVRDFESGRFDAYVEHVSRP